MIRFIPAVRDKASLLIALAGSSGSGKTYSALSMAQGMGRVAMIDTEHGRSSHYADFFQFDVAQLEAPFSPARYLEAIQAADQAGYDVLIIDSMSHEWAGAGGVIAMADKELADNKWMKPPLNWSKPKGAHKKMMNALLQIRPHVIFCLRAEPKIGIEKQIVDGKEKTVIIDLGWKPVCEKMFMYEMTCSFMLYDDAPGVPQPLKLQQQHAEAFPSGKQITSETGRVLAEWARSGSGRELSKSATTPTKSRGDTPKPAETAEPNLAEISRETASHPKASELLKLIIEASTVAEIDRAWYAHAMAADAPYAEETLSKLAKARHEKIKSLGGKT